MFLDAALSYAARGWKVVILRSSGKVPRLNAWPDKATDDPAVLKELWQRHPDSNVGVLLGEKSGIVDFEYDSPEEKAVFEEIFQGNVPSTSSFSSSRGTHFLFKWRFDLPQTATYKIGCLVWRTGGGGKGAQSVFPPSKHPDGRQYQWITPADTPLAEISDHVLMRIWNWDEIHAPCEYAMNDSDKALAALAGIPAAKAVDRMDWLKVGMALHSVDPGLLRVWDNWGRTMAPEKWSSGRAEVDWRSFGEKASGIHIGSLIHWAKEAGWTPPWAKNGAGKARAVSPVVQAEIEKESADMRLVIIRTDPKTYKLFSSKFEKHGKGFVELTSTEMCSFSAFRKKVLEGSQYMFSRYGQRNWDSRVQRLIDAATWEDAPLEQRRAAVVAEAVWNVLSDAATILDGQIPDKHGLPQKMDDGTITFVFTPTWKPLRMGPDQISKPEMSKILAACDVQKNNRTGRQEMTLESMQKLRKIVESALT